MSVVLIIDENSEKIKNQFLPMKGIFCDTANNFAQGRILLNSNQYDYIIVNYDINEEPRMSFFKECKKLQPNSTYHYIVRADPKKLDGGLSDEISIADSVIRRPIGHDNMSKLLDAENLVDQSDIDSLFNI